MDYLQDIQITALLLFLLILTAVKLVCGWHPAKIPNLRYPTSFSVFLCLLIEQRTLLCLPPSVPYPACSYTHIGLLLPQELLLQSVLHWLMSSIIFGLLVPDIDTSLHFFTFLLFNSTITRHCYIYNSCVVNIFVLYYDVRSADINDLIQPILFFFLFPYSLFFHFYIPALIFPLSIHSRIC